MGEQEVIARVLLVDDDPIFCELISKQLPEYNIKCDTATTAEEGIQILRDNPETDIIISDMKMDSVLSGIVLLEKAIQINPSIGRIVLTGFAGDIDWAFTTPGIWRLSKPCEISDLAIIIKRLSESVLLSDADKVLESLINSISDTNVDTSRIEKKLNGLLQNEQLRDIEEKITAVNNVARNTDSIISEHEKRRMQMEARFDARIDDVCSFYHKFILAILSGIGGIAVTILGIVLKFILGK